MPVKLLVLIDKTGRYDAYAMNLKNLCDELVGKALEMINKTKGQAVAYVECSNSIKNLTFSIGSFASSNELFIREIVLPP